MTTNNATAATTVLTLIGPIAGSQNQNRLTTQHSRPAIRAYAVSGPAWPSAYSGIVRVCLSAGRQRLEDSPASVASGVCET
jgi:hypothetical protein